MRDRNLGCDVCGDDTPASTCTHPTACTDHSFIPQEKSKKTPVNTKPGRHVLVLLLRHVMH